MLVSLIRSAIVYLLLIAAVRLMGKRQIGQMEPSEFVVAMLIADLAAVPMQDPGISLFSGVIPILTVFALELLLSALCFSCIWLRKLLCGRPVILMENGTILQESLKKTRLTPDELTELLREKGIVDLTTVKYAILETNGQISALMNERTQPPTAEALGLQTEPFYLPVTVICNGRMLRSNLKIAGKTEGWLMDELRKRSCRIKDVLLMTVEPSGRIYFTEKEHPT